MNEQLRKLLTSAKLTRAYVRDHMGVDAPLRNLLGERFRNAKPHMRADKLSGFAYWLGALDHSNHDSPDQRAACDELVRVAQDAIELTEEWPTDWEWDRDGAIVVHA